MRKNREGMDRYQPRLDPETEKRFLKQFGSLIEEKTQPGSDGMVEITPVLNGNGIVIGNQYEVVLGRKGDTKVSFTQFEAKSDGRKYEVTDGDILYSWRSKVPSFYVRQVNQRGKVVGEVQPTMDDLYLLYHKIDKADLAPKFRRQRRKLAQQALRQTRRRRDR